LVEAHVGLKRRQSAIAADGKAFSGTQPQASKSSIRGIAAIVDEDANCWVTSMPPVGAEELCRPMFRYFPSNYVWNLSVDLAIEMGARIGEIETMCAPLLEASKQPDARGSRAFGESWVKMGERLTELAREDEQRGRMISAGEKLARAAIYLLTAERMQSHSSPGRAQLYARLQHIFARAMALTGANCERVEIPYAGAHLAGLYVRAEGVSGAAPILVQINGLDSTKEMKYFVGLPQWLARRGVSSLGNAGPGTHDARLTYFAMLGSTLVFFGSSPEVQQITGLDAIDEATAEDYIALVVRSAVGDKVRKRRARGSRRLTVSRRRK
jgi:hypothetical protein